MVSKRTHENKSEATEMDILRGATKKQDRCQNGNKKTKEFKRNNKNSNYTKKTKLV